MQEEYCVVIFVKTPCAWEAETVWYVIMLIMVLGPTSRAVGHSTS